MSVILLLRHAHAESKTKWVGDDAQRPLSRRGTRESSRLVALLSSYGITRIASSPYLRCIQTVTPLAKKLGIEIEGVDQLAPGQAGALNWIRNAPDDGTLLVCSHGEVIGPIITALHDEDGVDFGRHPTWEKASTWLLARCGQTFGTADFLPAPA